MPRALRLASPSEQRRLKGRKPRSVTMLKPQCLSNFILETRVLENGMCKETTAIGNGPFLNFLSRPTRNHKVMAAGKRPGPAKASADSGRSVSETIEWEEGLFY